MHESHSSARGLTLLELLVVLALLTVLSMVSISTLSGRPSVSVRSTLDELEGQLVAAQRLASATGRDVQVASRGNWAANPETPLILAYGVQATPEDVLTAAESSPDAFRLRRSAAGAIERVHDRVGIASASGVGSNFIATAQSGSIPALSSKEPFSSQPGFQGLLGDSASNLFQGGTDPHAVIISGTTKRFMTSFWIGVVTTQDGRAIPNAPMGYLVVLASEGAIYKFYNPGSEGTGDRQYQWRKL